MAKKKKKIPPPKEEHVQNASPVCYAQSPELRPEYKGIEDKGAKK